MRSWRSFGPLTLPLLLLPTSLSLSLRVTSGILAACLLVIQTWTYQGYRFLTLCSI